MAQEPLQEKTRQAAKGMGAQTSASAAQQEAPASPEAAQQPAAAAAGTESAPEADMPNEELLYDLADLFKVFSDTTRIKILYSLMDAPRSVGDIADAIGATQSAVSHQLRILKQARLVRFSRDGRSVIYSLDDDHVHTMLSQGMTHICE